MGVFGIVLLVLFAIVCALLIFMVIIQDEDSDGLGGIFAGAGNAAFGSRSSNVVVRFTYILGALFFVIAFGLALVNRGSIGDIDKAIQEKGGQSTEWWDTSSSAPAETAPSELAPAAAPDAAQTQPTP